MKRITLALIPCVFLACASGPDATAESSAPPKTNAPATSTANPTSPGGSDASTPGPAGPAAVAPKSGTAGPQPPAKSASGSAAPAPVAPTPPASANAGGNVGGDKQGAAPRATPPAANGSLGPPLIVYGQVIPETDLQRYFCFSIGNKQVDSAKFLVVVHNELERRKTAGEDVSKYEVSDAVLDAAIEKQRKDFLLKYPTLDFATEVGRAFLSLDLYRQELRQTMLFDRLFMPDDPETWPPLTTEAIVNATGGRDFVDDAKESYLQRKKMMEDQGLTELPPDDPIFTEALRSWVLEALNSFAVHVTDPAKIPAGALMTVDGVPVMIDPIFQKIRPYITDELLAQARRFTAQMAVTERDLAAQGKLITREKFEETFMPGISFQDALAAYEMLALTVMGFPSMESYCTYERLSRSYRQVVDEQIKDDDLMRQYLPRANQISGAARINAEVILASAYDYDHVRWKPNGFAEAEKKANALKAQLDQGANWADVLELSSDFWDPPMPEVGQKPQFGFRFKGRFGEQTRNQLVGDVDESDFTILITGDSVGDKIFFDQELGSIAGPFKGQRGYYISRVISRSPPASTLNMANAKHREFLVDHYIKQAFGDYSRGLLKQAIEQGQVKGL